MGARLIMGPHAVTPDVVAELQREVADLYREHGGSLLRYAASLTRQPEIAREAVQETFLRYFAERRYGRTIEKPRPWLYIVVRNYVLKQAGSPEERVEIDSDEVDTLPSTGSDPEILALSSETERTISESLTDRELQCVHLRLDGLSYSEIAEILEIRPGTVGALLSRAYSKLRRALVQTADAKPGVTQKVSRLGLKGGSYAF